MAYVNVNNPESNTVMDDTFNEPIIQDQNHLTSDASSSTDINSSGNKYLLLSSKIDQNFQIKVGPKVIAACSILKNVLKFTVNRSDPIETEMSKKQLEKFCQLHQHFADDDSWDKTDPKFVEKFFGEFSDQEFLKFCWAADFLDSQRFLNNAAAYLIIKLKNMEVEDFQKYLNIFDDYTADERNAIKTSPFRYFIDAATKVTETSQQSSNVLTLKNLSKVNPHPQNFSFPKPFIYAAFTSTTAKIPADLLFKLYSTCKYFFAKVKYIPVSFFSTSPNEMLNLYYSEENIYLPLEDLKNIDANFNVFEILIIYTSLTAEFYQQLFSKVHCHDLFHGIVLNRDITFTVNEFKMVFSNVKRLNFQSNVVNSDGNVVTLEDFLSFVPSATDLKYWPSSPECYTSKSAENIAALKHKEKFDNFELFDIPSHFINAKGFASFIQNHANPVYSIDTNFKLSFNENVNVELLSSFYSEVLTAINTWETKNQKIRLVIRQSDEVLFISKPYENLDTMDMVD